MQLRPSGTKGPVAVSFAAFESYYAGEAETWEYLALTRARVAWATSPAFAARAAAAIEATLRGPAMRAGTAADVRGMRAADGARAAGVRLLGPEARATAAWSTSSSPPSSCSWSTPPPAGRCGRTPPRRWRRWREAGLAPAGLLDDLADAWRLQQDLSQLLQAGARRRRPIRNTSRRRCRA